MQYRSFGKLDWKVSALGFGCMRLPTLGGDSANIDETEATRMLHSAIDHGVNYLDTAYPYHGGNSERFVGRMLKGGYRQKVRLATKLPCWKVEASGDFDLLLNEQLQKLQTEHINFYLLHGLNQDRWHKMRDLGVLERAERALADGRIGHLGFSFHDKYPVFQEIVDAHNCPIPCTRCEYCLPCPNGVAIPRVFTIYNEGMMYDKPDVARGTYRQWVPAENQASACLKCLECEDKCPQSIPISEWMPVVQQVLGEGKPYVRQLEVHPCQPNRRH